MRRAAWLLWLMLALLPLRGWAVASMEVGTWGGASAVEAGLAETAQPPCHPAQPAEAQPDGGPAPGNCLACDWCHAALDVVSHPAMPARTAPAVAPLPRLERDTGRALAGGLERPPRSGLA